MDQVKIRAAVAAHGLTKNAEVTVAETPVIAGAIKSGVFELLERIPEDEAPVPNVEDVELPDPPAKAPRKRG